MRINHRSLTLVAAVGLLTAFSACEGPFNRTAYLQSGTPTSIVVKWGTTSPLDSRVDYGTDPGNLNMTVQDPTAVTDHEVHVTALTPDTTYYYAYGTTDGNLAGGDSDHFFVTPPVAGTPKPTRVWVIGDSGTADLNALAVKNAYLAYTGARGQDLWMMLGDNAYSDGTQSDYQAAVFDTYPEILRNTVLWPTLGNHDGHSAFSSTQTGPYYDIFTLPTAGEAGGAASGTEAYYSFDYANVHFVCLESHQTIIDATGGPAMLAWLDLDLGSTTQDWIVAFWHHPPYTKGSHDSDFELQLIRMREDVLPILEGHGVDLVLAGHSHSYERSFLLDGHYGLSGTLTPEMVLDGGNGRETGDGAYEKMAAPHEGAVYAVAGSSGKTSGGPLNHPAMFLSLNLLGSMVLDFDGPRLDATFLDSTGTVQDTFTILHGL